MHGMYKSLHSILEYDVSESWNKTDFLGKVNDVIQLKRNRKYFTKITGQMAITGADEYNFVV